MTLLRLSVFALALSAIGPAQADDVRPIEPARHSLIPFGSGPDARKAQADPGTLKPRGQDVPSPILVELEALIADDGQLSLGCDIAGVPDFRRIATQVAGREPAR